MICRTWRLVNLDDQKRFTRRLPRQHEAIWRSVGYVVNLHVVRVIEGIPQISPNLVDGSTCNAGFVL